MKCFLRRESWRPAWLELKITTSPAAVGIGVINCKMKKAMKKITYLLIAAMSVVSVASCVKELTPEPASFEGMEQEFTVTLPAETRTALVEGKTVWAKGDSLWVYNGVSSESVVVPEEFWGKKEFKFVVKTATFSDTTKTIYVVYPYAAAGGVTDGQVKVKIPGVQDGRFATANIAAAVSEDYNVSLKNVTAVLKVTVPAETDAQITDHIRSIDLDAVSPREAWDILYSMKAAMDV